MNLNPFSAGTQLLITEQLLVAVAVMLVVVVVLSLIVNYRCCCLLLVASPLKTAKPNCDWISVVLGQGDGFSKGEQ